VHRWIGRGIGERLSAPESQHGAFLETIAVIQWRRIRTLQNGIRPV